MTPDQIALLEDKVSVWRRHAETGPQDYRDYNNRAADALAAALAELQAAALSPGGAESGATVEQPSKVAAPPESQDGEKVAMERLQAIIDWADFAVSNRAEFDSHGVRNLTGPVFDAARETLAKRALRDKLAGGEK